MTLLIEIVCIKLKLFTAWFLRRIARGSSCVYVLISLVPRNKRFFMYNCTLLIYAAKLPGNSGVWGTTHVAPPPLPLNNNNNNYLGLPVHPVG